MVELDYDKVLSELTKLPTAEQNEIPDILEAYLHKIAKNGDVVYSWDVVKPFLLRKLENVMDTFNKNHPMHEEHLKPPNCQKFVFEETKKNILGIFSKFLDPPFTTQRLCEILSEPGKHYRRLDKLMRGIERNVLVVSPLPPMPENYWDDYQKESSFKELYSNCSLANTFKSAFDDPEETEPAELINEIETNGESTSYDNSYITNTQHMSNTFYDHHIQSHPNSHPMLETMSELHSAPGSTHQSSSHTPSNLAPLQQLDSFTNVFASTTTHLTHLSSNSTYSLDASMSSSSWSSTLKGPYEAVIQHSDDPHSDDNENIIVDDEEDEDEEEVDKIPPSTEPVATEPFFSTITESVPVIPTVSEIPLVVETSVEPPQTALHVPSLEIQTDTQEVVVKKRLSPTPLEEIVKEEQQLGASTSLTPKKIKIDDEAISRNVSEVLVDQSAEFAPQESVAIDDKQVSQASIPQPEATIDLALATSNEVEALNEKKPPEEAMDQD